MRRQSGSGAPAATARRGRAPAAAPAAPARRVRRSPEESRALILEAAIRVLSRRGPEAVGLKDVAAEAGVSHALVVHYFGTYDALVEVAVLECAARLRRRLLERMGAAQDSTPASLMRIYLEAALEPWYGRLVSWALLSDHEGTKSFAAQLAPEIEQIAAGTHQLLRQRAPGISRARSEAFIVALWSLAVGYVAGNGFFWRALGRSPGPQRDRELRAAVDALVTALVG